MSPQSKNQLRTYIASQIKRIREKKHLTQSDIAISAGLSTNYFARVERGEVNPSLETFCDITKALKVKSSDILPF